MEPRRATAVLDAGSDQSNADSRELLFIDNYKDTGIGAFGVTLFGSLERVDPRCRLEYTQTSKLQGLAQCLRIARHRGPLVANVGLTSWGRSKVLNLLAFLAMGVRHGPGRRTLILLHNVVEVTEEGDTGYQVSYLIRLGARVALRLNSRASFVVFSRAILEVLLEKYDIGDVTFSPLPCPPCCPAATPPARESRPVVVSFGYLSPYKGIETLLDAYPGFREVADLLVIGRPHPVLLREPDYARTIERLRRRMLELGVRYVSYVPEEELCSILTSCRLGILPYSSTTGTSASFTHFAAAGLPAVATNLREFQELSRDGAGLRLTEGDPGSIAGSIRDLLSRPSDLDMLSQRQFIYARAHTFGSAALRIEEKVRS